MAHLGHFRGLGGPLARFWLGTSGQDSSRALARTRVQGGLGARIWVLGIKSGGDSARGYHRLGLGSVMALPCRVPGRNGSFGVISGPGRDLPGLGWARAQARAGSLGSGPESDSRGLGSGPESRSGILGSGPESGLDWAWARGPRPGSGNLGSSSSKLWARIWVWSSVPGWNSARGCYGIRPGLGYVAPVQSPRPEWLIWVIFGAWGNWPSA